MHLGYKMDLQLKVPTLTLQTPNPHSGQTHTVVKHTKTLKGLFHVKHDVENKNKFFMHQKKESARSTCIQIV